MDATGHVRKTSAGSVQLMLGSHSHAHKILSQLKRSSEPLSAVASALRVLRTTRGILRLDQAIGQITDSWFWAILESVVKMIVPCLEAEPRFVSKEASEKAQNETWSSLMGTITKLTGFFLASSKTRFASKRSSIHALGIWDCKIPTLALMSGRVCTAAY